MSGKRKKIGLGFLGGRGVRRRGILGGRGVRGRGVKGRLRH